MSKAKIKPIHIILPIAIGLVIASLLVFADSTIIDPDPGSGAKVIIDTQEERKTMISPDPL